MLVKKNLDVEYRPLKMIEGLPVRGEAVVKVLMFGDEMVMLEIRYSEGAGSPIHKHTHESVCYVLEGKIKAMVGGETSILGVGDSCRHPTGVLHSVDAYEGAATFIEIKSPVQDLTQFLGTE